MEREVIGWIAIGALFVLLVLRVPVAVALMSIGFVGYWAVAGLDPALRILGVIPYSKVATYSFTVVPLFIIMGHFAYHAGFAADLFRTAQRWVGSMPGGLVQATIVGATGFGAACGSGLASCAIISKLAVPGMIQQRVQRPLAFGAVAAAGTIAQMIPPSILMVIYGIIAEQSIGRLLIAGIVPGVVAGLVYMAMVYIRVKRNPSLAPALPSVGWAERFGALRGVWGIALLAVIVMGGLYSGAFTPTEAGAIGAFGAFGAAVILRRLGWTDLWASLLDTSRTTATVFFIVAGAFVFGYFLGITRIPTQVSSLITSLAAPPIVILLSVMVFYIVLGTFMDMIAAMFLTLPIILPAMDALGFNLVWFGVLMVHLCEMALITPPFGLNLFIMKSVIPGAEMKEVIQGVGPFIVADLVTLALYIAFPQLALFLPERMLG